MKGVHSATLGNIFTGKAYHLVEEEREKKVLAGVVLGRVGSNKNVCLGKDGHLEQLVSRN